MDDHTNKTPADLHDRWVEIDKRMSINPQWTEQDFVEVKAVKTAYREATMRLREEWPEPLAPDKVAEIIAVVKHYLPDLTSDQEQRIVAYWNESWPDPDVAGAFGPGYITNTKAISETLLETLVRDDGGFDDESHEVIRHFEKDYGLTVLVDKDALEQTYEEWCREMKADEAFRQQQD